MYKKKDVLFQLDFLVSKKKKKKLKSLIIYLGKKGRKCKSQKKGRFKKNQTKNLNLIFHILHSD